MPIADKTAQQLCEQAARCRRLAKATTDAIVSRRLLDLALEFDALAEAAEKREREARAVDGRAC